MVDFYVMYVVIGLLLIGALFSPALRMVVVGSVAVVAAIAFFFFCAFFFFGSDKNTMMTAHLVWYAYILGFAIWIPLLIPPIRWVATLGVVITAPIWALSILHIWFPAAT